MRVTVEPREDRQVRVRSLDLGHLVEYGLDEGPEYDGVMDLAKAAIDRIGVPGGVQVDIESEAPPGSGLGGSSALVTAVVAALAMLQERAMTRTELAQMSYAIERDDLNISGGWQDQYAAAFGGCNLIEFRSTGVQVTPVASEPARLEDLRRNLLLCYTGKVRRNVGLIDTQIELFRSGREETLLGMKQLVEMAYAMRGVIEAGDLERLGQMLHDAFEAKKRMNPHIAEHTPIEAMLDAARDAGALRRQDLRCRRWRLPADRVHTGRSAAVRSAAGVHRRPVRAVRLRPRRGAGDEGRRGLDAHRHVSEARRFALLDRDGTINTEVDHLSDPDELVLIPARPRRSDGCERTLGSGSSWSRTRRTWVAACSRPASSMRSMSDSARCSAAEGAAVDAILVCPHAPEDDCACRKPRPGMALEAAERFGFDPADAFVVGDHAGDVGMGRAIGATTFLVMTGHGPAEVERAREDADHVVPDLAAAVDIIAGSSPASLPPTDLERAPRERRRVPPRRRRLPARGRGHDAGHARRCLDDVVTAADVLTTSFRAGGKLLICGNGGSAADAQHLATEFVSTFTIDNPRPLDPGDGVDDGLVAAHRDRERLRRRGHVRAAGGIARTRRRRADGHLDQRQLSQRDPRGRTGARAGATGHRSHRRDRWRSRARRRRRDRVPSTVTAHIQECHLAIEQLLASLVEGALFPRT